MSTDPNRDKTYRVIAIRTDGTRVFVQGKLAKSVADAVRSTVIGTFPDAVIEDEAEPLSPEITGDSR